MGDPSENGEGEGEGGGFLSENQAKNVEGGNGYFGIGGLAKGLDLVGGAADLAGASKAFGAISAFTGGAGSFSTMANAWKNGLETVEGGESFLGGAGSALGGKLLPGIGTGLSVAGMAADGALLANDIKKEGFSGAYHDQEAYNHAGGVALNAAHAVLPWLGPYGEAANLALTGGELAADGAGKAAGWAFGDKAKFNADSVTGGLIRGMAGDQSLGEQARKGVTSVLGHGALGNGVGIAADVATNVAAMPLNLANTVGRGVWNEGSAIVDSIANGKGAVGHALNGAGKWVGNEASTIGHGIENGAGSAWNFTKNLFGGIGNGIGSAASTVGHGIGSAASTVGHGISNAASAVGSGISNAGHAVSSGVSKVLHW